MRKARKDIRQLDRIYKRDKGVCHLCKLWIPREIASRDRIIPGSEGGKYTYYNLKLACTRCNSARGNSTIEDFLNVIDFNRTEAYRLQQEMENEE